MKATTSHSNNIHTAHSVINDELAQPRYSLFGEYSHDGSNLNADGNGIHISFPRSTTATASIHDVLSDALDIADELDAWIQQVEERRRGGTESKRQQ
jgi:hypothetical protein